MISWQGWPRGSVGWSRVDGPPPPCAAADVRLPRGAETRISGERRADLAELSLVQSYRGDTGALRLHDVLRAFVRGELGRAAITRLNRGLLGAAAARLLDSRSDPPQWWLIPAEADYYWRYLSYHLVEADEADELHRVVCDLRWIVRRIVHYGAAAAETDVQRAAGPEAAALSSVLARDGHLCGTIEPAEAVADIVVSRLQGMRELADVVLTAPGKRRLRNRWPLPDTDPALLRVLTGHRGWTTACDISADGQLLATVGRDGTARIWNLSDGATRIVLDGAGGALATCVFLSDGTRLITGGEDAQVRVWDLDRGIVARVLAGHTGAVTSCALAPRRSPASRSHPTAAGWSPRPRTRRPGSGPPPLGSAPRSFTIRKRLRTARSVWTRDGPRH